MKEKEIQFTPIQRTARRSAQFTSIQTIDTPIFSEEHESCTRMSAIELLVGTTIFWIGPVACGIAEMML